MIYRQPFRRTIWILIGIVLLSSVFIYERSFYQTGIRVPLDSSGVCDVRSFDPQANILLLPFDMDYYPNKLYSPEDFADHIPGETQRRSSFPDASSNAYGTHHMIIQAEPNTSYLMTGFSTDYGMKLYANGSKIIEIGTVADTPSAAVPRIDYFTVPLTADDDGLIDMIVQYSNFVHRSGGAIFDWQFSTPNNIMSNYQIWIFMNAFFGAGFLVYALFVFFSGIINKQHLFLVVAALSVDMALRNQNFFYGMFLKPDYNWFLCYRLNLIFTFSEPYFLYYAFCWMMPLARKRILSWSCGIINFTMIVLMFLFPTQYSSPICIVATIIGAFLIFIMFINYAYSLRGRKLTSSDYAIISSCILTAVVGLTEIITYKRSSYVTRSGMMSIVVLVFIYVIKACLDYQNRKNMREYKKQKDLADALETQRKVRQEFMANLSHEMRTPLAVIGGYAQRIQLRLSKHPELEEGVQLSENLQVIFSEASRLGTLVSQLLDSSTRKEREAENIKVDLYDMHNEIKNLSQPILEKNKNSLDIVFPEQMPNIYGNRNLIREILINLMVNANRHCKEDTMILRAQFADTNDIVCLSLEDHGDGMTKEQLENATHSGWSGDGGSGLGLAICADAMQLMKGTMRLESTLGKGTTVKLFFQVWKQELD